MEGDKMKDEALKLTITHILIAVWALCVFKDIILVAPTPWDLAGFVICVIMPFPIVIGLYLKGA
jgi:hypothetical protein